MAATTLPATQENDIRALYAAKASGVITRTRWGAAALSVIGLAIIAPVAIMALQAGLALIAAGVLALGAAAAWKMLPYWLQVIENRRTEFINAEMNRHLAAMKAEAAKNPIEQIQNEYLRRAKQIEQFREALVSILSAISDFARKLEKTRTQTPGIDLSQETDALEKMKLFYNRRKERLEEGVKQLAAYKKAIEAAQAKWDLKIAANAAYAAMNAGDQSARMAEILSDVAFDSVQKEFDNTFARLDLDSDELTSKKLLEFGPGAAVDISFVGITANVTKE